MIGEISGFIFNLGLAFYNFFYAVTHPSLWLDWSDKQALMRFIYYGGSIELFYVMLAAFLVLTGIGIWRSNIMWATVRLFEGIGNTVGRLIAWAGLVMVFQQVMIVFLQRIFRVAEISIGPFGYTFTADLSWFGEELKLYNALVVCLCCAYTFVQGGHVRVDLFYASAKFRTKKIIDMVGSLLFMMPALLLVWLFAWFFMWRHLIVPKPSASDTLDRLLLKARAIRWNVETIGFSPSGFNGYFLFKVLLVLFAAMMMLQAVAFFYRSLLEYREGEKAAGKYLDKDSLNGETAPVAPKN